MLNSKVAFSRIYILFKRGWGKWDNQSIIFQYLNRLVSIFTMDVIARCAFGMTINNLGEKDDPFITKAKAVFNPAANKSPFILIACKLIHVFHLHWLAPIISVELKLLLLLLLITVIFPKLMATFADRLFFLNEFYFFINILEGLIKERANSAEASFEIIPCLY